MALGIDLYMHWYVIHTKPKQEFRAAQNLEQQGYTIFLPTIPVQKLHKNTLQITQEALFARYLFIQLDQVSSNWFPIRSTRGVHQMVRFGIHTEPVKVHHQLIEELKNLAIEKTTKPLFSSGESVYIQEGPFKGLEASFQKLLEEPSGESRALILIEILGKTQDLKIPTKHIIALA
jgi:transcriptional antiterminator RfaH